MLDGALKGVKVLDLSRILAGPWCTQNLADMGADIIKVENPDGGDDTREWGPHYLDFPGDETRLSAYFASCNRGKKSVAIDFSKAQGAAIVRHLASKADIVVENFKSGSLAKYGLDYETLSALNPRVIYLSITGFGQKGPMAGRPGYDYVFQGAGGLLSYTGWPEGEPGAGPVRVGASIIDVSTGMYGTVAVLGALFQRTQTGTGQHIDLALSDVAIAINANNNLSYLISGQSPKRLGNAHANLAPYEIFPCADGYIVLAVGNDQQFARFCKVAGRPEMVADSRYVTNEDRLKNRASLREAVGEALLGRTQHEWGDAFDANGIPWGPINTLEQVFASPQTKYRKMAQTLTHHQGVSVPTVRNPVAMVDVSGSKAPPLLGEDTHAVLTTLELSPADIEQLEAQGVVRTV
ncbi:CaiB/BaiF CoA-transferase family protein [Burkholderia sp. BCC0397]|uniref:CaiB/BaiF CoA transferase family protein n=1 Tax=Burkholderia sp. BCC0397 TaxID=486876 RepID=UPI00158C05A2|nr:CaiB/BaiF CoA-transferase family protein [Burkholderia sp. BCC0397]